MGDIIIPIQGTKEYIVTHEDATKYTVSYLRNPPQDSFGNYGYDLYLDNVLIHYCKDKFSLNHWDSEKERKTLSPLFMDVCWELSRQGILRPYTRDIHGQGTTQGSGYSITAFGMKWLKESDLDDYVPTEPDRFAQMIEPYRAYFGVAFHHRAQEAIRCYNAHAYLACCTMAGSAAETILISIANKIDIDFKPKENITKIRNKIISKSESGIKENLIAYSDIVKYWRDEGMHHNALDISPNKAYISLAMLYVLQCMEKKSGFNSFP